MLVKTIPLSVFLDSRSFLNHQFANDFYCQIQYPYPPLSWTMILWMISTPKNNAPYAFSVQSVSCCFSMTDFRNGSACVGKCNGKVQKGPKRSEKVKPASRNPPSFYFSYGMNAGKALLAKEFHLCSEKNLRTSSLFSLLQRDSLTYSRLQSRLWSIQRGP